MQKLYRVTIKPANRPGYECEKAELNFGNYNEAVLFIDLFNTQLNMYRRVLASKHKAFGIHNLNMTPEEFISGLMQEDEYKIFCFGHMSPFIIEKCVRSEILIEITEIYVIYAMHDDYNRLISINMDCPICGKKSIITEYEKHEIVSYNGFHFLVACKYNKCSKCTGVYGLYENHKDDDLKDKFDRLLAFMDKYKDVLDEVVEGPVMKLNQSRDRKMSSRYTC